MLKLNVLQSTIAVCFSFLYKSLRFISVFVDEMTKSDYYTLKLQQVGKLRTMERVSARVTYINHSCQLLLSVVTSFLLLIIVEY